MKAILDEFFEVKWKCKQSIVIAPRAIIPPKSKIVDNEAICKHSKTKRHCCQAIQLDNPPWIIIMQLGFRDDALRHYARSVLA